MRTALRYLWRALSIILLILFAGIVVLVILTRTPLVNRILRDKVVAFVAANYRGALRIGRIEGSVWGSLRLDEVALLYQGKTIAFIPRLSLDYSLLPILWRTVHLRISIDSPQIEAIREPNGKWNLLDALSGRVPTAPSSAKRSLAIDVDSVQVNHGTLHVMPSGESGPKYQLMNLDLDTSVTVPSSGMAVALHKLTANIAGPRMPLLYTAVSLEYDAIASPATVRLTDLDVR
ncbi:MAG: hypothetical protein JO166_19615, partial [Deltaproteobacteria bacterium]|nr:hypothetical protein [Deltaproteobacteria bacterium]